ncbi:MAG: aryl-sulfate sulfotransferase [Myxococcota bacterium]
MTRVGERVVAGEDATVTTGAVPDELARISTDGEAPAWGDYTLFSWWSLPEEESFVVALDRAGNVVWYWMPDTSYVQSMRVSEDGTEILALCAFVSPDPDAYLARIPLDGGDPTILPAPNAHHDLHEQDGTLAYLAADLRELEGEEVLGDLLVEVSPDGEQTTVWDAFEDWPVTQRDGWDKEPADWTHANGLGYTPDGDAWMVSLYYDKAIVALERGTGAQVWKLGGIEGDFALVGDDAFFQRQHAPSWVDGELLLFDNGYDADTSRAVQYALDRDAGTATLTWAYVPAGGEHTRIMGDAHRLPDGATVVSWGELGYLDVIDAEGQAVHRTSVSGDGGILGRIQRRETLYPTDSTFPG